MPKQELVVIGASAGGVEALKTVASGLPRDFPAAVLVVLHIGKGIDGRTHLPKILTAAGPLPASQAIDSEEIRPGHLYVAKPDCHLTVDDGHIRVTYGPKENRTRPAINPLFRTAAKAYGPRVTGVILTGTLDDGVAGLAEIKRCGGIAVVQDPETAVFPDMPVNAIANVDVDYIVAPEQIGATLVALSTMDRAGSRVFAKMSRTLLETRCPECSGPLWEERQGRITEYRCRIGHAYSPLSLRAEQKEAIERALWASVIALQDAGTVAGKLHNIPDVTPDREASVRDEQAKAITRMLNRDDDEK